MGLSRNKVAVSEGAAGSPPFYGESTLTNTKLVVKRVERRLLYGSLFNFEGSFGEEKQSPIKKYGGVAQLGEHLPCKQGVMGSNPIISTTGCGTGAEKRQRTAETKKEWPRGLPQILAHSSGG